MLQGSDWGIWTRRGEYSVAVDWLTLLIVPSAIGAGEPTKCAVSSTRVSHRAHHALGRAYHIRFVQLR